MSYVKIPGVPPLLNKLSNVTSKIVQLGADVAFILRIKPKWGVYQKNKSVLLADSVIGFDFRQEYHISDTPQEEGAFQSYNKVSMPYDARVKLTKSGTDSEREVFLSQLATIAKSLELYDVVTPNKTYSSASIVHYEYSQTAQRGLGLLTVEIWLREVRVTLRNTFAATKSPASADPTTSGVVQAK